MFHTTFQPFGPQPIVDKGEWEEWPNPPMWPEPLLGKSLKWRYLGAAGAGHAWQICEKGGEGFDFKVWGDRVWGEVDLSPEKMGEEHLAKVLAAAIGREFASSGMPQPGKQVDIGLWRNDFIQAGLVSP